jgi:putative FmdB family regulatory protein
MITYVYRCPTCLYEFEKEQNLSDKPIKKCPCCEGRKCERLLCEPIVVTIDPRSLGFQAEKNTRNMGTYEREAKQAKLDSQKEARLSKIESAIPGAKNVTSKPNKDIVNLNKKINKMTSSQKKKYILEGK